MMREYQLIIFVKKELLPQINYEGLPISIDHEQN